jgi:hypothetical protein
MLTVPVFVLTPSKITTERSPVLATYSRSAAASRVIKLGELSVVFAPVIVAAGVALPLPVKALSKRKMDPPPLFDT